MLDFHQKRKMRSVIYSRVTLGVLFLLVLFFLHSTWAVYKKKTGSEEMKAMAFARVEELRGRDTELKDKIQRIATPLGVEEEIRSKFSVAKDRENIVIIVQEEASATVTPAHKGGLWATLTEWFTK